jgi:hypothetical protein
MTRCALAVGLVLIATAGSRISLAATNAERIGCTHVDGKYFFTTDNFLNEGATQIHRTGMRVIKLYFNPPSYPFNSTWPAAFRNLVEAAQHPYYQTVFAIPFKTYVFSIEATAGDWHNGVTASQAAAERQQFHDLAQYFLTTFRGTGKTFILQHWEGDWSLRGTTDPNPIYNPSPVAVQGMIDWLNARQDGVDQARAEVIDTDVKVYHACEVNKLDWAMSGMTTVTNDVLPGTHCDLYSYSAWDKISFGRQAFHDALDYLAAKAPDSAAFGNRNIYIGEFGWPEQGNPNSFSVIRDATEEALSWDCPYMIYWEVYDNECSTSPATIADCRGFWMIRPDGSKAPAYDYFVSKIDPTPLGVNLARGATQVVTSSYNLSSQQGPKAIDGVISAASKWTSSGSAPPHWLALDLGASRTVHSYVVRHAGAGGETSNYNTEQFRIQSGPSLSGPWADEAVVDNSNRYGVSLRSYFTPKTLRYVRLYITGPGIDNYARIPEFEVWGDPGSPEFTGTPVSGRAPLAVQFADQSTGNIDAWFWDFGDGTTSSSRSPSHTYTRGGVFTVTLTITDLAGSRARTRIDYIRVVSTDIDGDGDVDQEDFGHLQACLSGSGMVPAPGCDEADLDIDGDVDQHDFTALSSCMAGENQPPGC